MPWSRDKSGRLFKTGGGSGSAPVPPVLTSLVPSPVTVGVGKTVQAIGTGFTASSVLRLDGVAQPTTFQDATHISMVADFPAAATYSVTARNGAAVSNALSLVAA
jgi:hypothetical protein